MKCIFIKSKKENEEMTYDIETRINQTLGKFLTTQTSDKSAIEFAKYLIHEMAIEKENELEPKELIVLELSILEKIKLVLEDRKHKGAKLKLLNQQLGFSSRSSVRKVSNALSRRSDDIVQIPERQGGTYYLTKYAPCNKEKAPEPKAPEPKASRKKSKRKVEGTTARNETMRFCLENPNQETKQADIKTRLERIGYNPESVEYVLVNLSKQGLINWDMPKSIITLTEKGKAYDPGPMPSEVKQKLGV